jgi:hypothetical protein
MPPIFLHMAVARDVSESVTAASLAAEEGTYLFGASAPDIRVIARWDRERTHFFKLDELDHQDSVANFFAAHPELAAAERLNAPTAAFIAGYLSHLALDETWIEQVYRPYFGQVSALGGDEMADTLDRILQYELDLRRRSEPQTRDEIAEALDQCSLALDVGFLDSETLRRWQEVASDQTKYPADWERFRAQARRHLRDRGVESEADWERFRDQIPDLLQRVIDHVSTEQVDAFLEEGKERAAAAVRRYLGVTA